MEICHRRPFPSATPGYSLWQKLCESAKHQRRHSAWVGQADFGKLGLNNSHHSGNCHRLSVNSKQKICNKINSARDRYICFSSCSFFTMDGRRFYYYNSSQLPIYFGSNAEYSPYVYSAQGQSCGPEEATILELLRALRRIPHHRLRNSADQVLHLLLLRKDECTLAGQTMKKKCCRGYGLKIFGLLSAITDIFFHLVRPW